MPTKSKSSKTKEIVAVEIVEEEIVEQVEEVITLPKRFSIYPLPSDGAVLPKTSYPYYPLAQQGMYMIRPLLIGDALVTQKYIPSTVPKMSEEYEKGTFWWNIDPIPANICASIVAWFKHIYEKQHTEAEVLLLLNHKTMEWKIWIPTQQVSHGGVKSVYEPSELPKGYTLVGSMHSHCDFSAFHSGTDTGDAQEFDGIHLTIGHIMDEKPEVVAMVMVNKQQFDYSDISIVADFSDLTAGTYEDFWDDFVTENSNLVSGHKPKGWELFAKYAPVTKAVVPYTGSYPYATPPVTNGWRPQREFGDFSPESWARRPDSDFSWFGDDEIWAKYFDERYPVRDNTRKLFEDDHWEDGLDDKIVDAILDSKSIQEKDIDHVQDNPQDGYSLLYWRGLFMAKMADNATVLDKLGLEVSYHLKPKKMTQGDK